LLKLGAARKEAGKAYALLVIYTPTKDQPVTCWRPTDGSTRPMFSRRASASYGATNVSFCREKQDRAVESGFSAFCRCKFCLPVRGAV
jgi:hypothetical protein